MYIKWPEKLPALHWVISPIVAASFDQVPFGVWVLLREQLL